MRQLTFIRPGKLEWAEVSVPRLEMRQEAIVRPIVVGRCDLDTGYVAGGWPTQIGIYAAGIAVALGAGRVVYVDTYENRLALAQRFGARARNPPIALKPEYGIVVDSCRDADTLRRAIRATELEGIFTSCTIHRGDATPLPLQEMYWKGITFRTGCPNVRSQIEPVLDLCAAGFDPSLLETIVAPFDDAPDAFLDDAVSVAVRRA